MEEIWRPAKYVVNNEIIDYTDYYLISNYGRVRSVDRYVTFYLGKKNVKGKIKKIRKNHRGYIDVPLSKEGIMTTCLVHRLVAFAFPEICGEWFEGAECNHKDENPENNCAENLEWVSHYDNMNYGTRTERVKEKTSKHILQYDKEGIFIKEWNSIAEARKYYQNITKCLKGKRKYSGGFIWKYK